jgi:signal transduction histidine kinase
MLAVGFSAGAMLRKQRVANKAVQSQAGNQATAEASVEPTVPPSMPPNSESTQTAEIPANIAMELEALQAQLRQTQVAYQMAQQSERFKAGFLARTSHELRSPLNSAMSLQQLILSDLCEDAAEEREFIAQAYAASQKMLGLLDKLIGVSKVAYGTEQLQIQPVCLEDVFMEVESLTLMQAQNRSQQLKIEYPNSDVWVMADPRWLRQVLVSLVDTPISLMQEGAIQVTSQVMPEQQEVWIQIEDQRPAWFWREPLDLLQTLTAQGRLDPSSASKPDLTDLTELGHVPSPSLSLFVNQTILELMNGRLEVLAVPTEEDTITRIQAVIPLAEDFTN